MKYFLPVFPDPVFHLRVLQVTKYLFSNFFLFFNFIKLESLCLTIGSSSANTKHKKGFVYSSIHNLVLKPKKKQGSSYGAPVSSSATQVTSVTASEAAAPISKTNAFSKGASQSISKLLESIV